MPLIQPWGTSNLLSTKYKDSIYYAYSDAPLSNEAISAAEATSVGNALESLKLETPVHVTSEAERNSIFPNPVQGNGVYRLDYGWEERYYDAYNSSTNPGGKTPAGWYKVNNGLQIINPTTVTATGGTYNIVGTGRINFTNATKINLTGNIFTRDYAFLELEFRTICSVASELRFSYSYAGTDLVLTNYVYGGYMHAAGALNFNSGITVGYYGLTGSTTATTHSMKMLLSNVYETNKYPRVTWNHTWFTPGAVPNTRHDAGFYNVLPAPVLDGFSIYPAAAANMTGTISINGYN